MTAATAPLQAVRSGPEAPPAAAATQPNIVVIMVDDLAARMVDDLPRLRSQLTKQGLSFTSTYVAAPVCGPSRASFLRAQYPHNTGMVTNGPPSGGFPYFRKHGLEASTIATWLHDAGYRTALIGKYLNFYERDLKHVPKGWDRWFVYGGKGKYRRYRVSDQGKVRFYGKKNKRRHYQTDVLARKAVRFIEDAPAGQPLFLFLAPSAPHEPATPALRHKKAKVPRKQAPRVPSHNETDVDDKPRVWRARGTMGRKRQRKADKVYVRQLKCMYAVEDMIDDVYNALDATNRRDNTYLFFVSDNGYHYGEHRVARSKNTPFEESILTPLIVVGPGVPEGRSTDALASLIDLGPTIAELAGAETPDFVDGRSLVPFLEDRSPSGWRNAVISELKRGPFGGFAVMRKGNYALTHFRNGDRELYDLSVDPYQLDNLSESGHPELPNLEAQLDALTRCGSGETPCQEADRGN